MLLSNARESRGFTLIELLVVMVILTIVTGVAVLGLTQATRRALSDAYDQLETGLFELSAQATLQNANFRLTLERQSFSLARWDGSDWQSQALPEALRVPESIRLTDLKADTRTGIRDYLFLSTGQVSPRLQLELSDSEQAGLTLTWPENTATEASNGAH